jgi:hypothetical protein
MTLSELIDQLTNLAEELNPSGDLFSEHDPDVLVAYQPNWPMETNITQAVIVGPESPAIIIGTSHSSQYLRPRGAAALDWR